VGTCILFIHLQNRKITVQTIVTDLINISYNSDFALHFAAKKYLQYNIANANEPIKFLRDITNCTINRQMFQVTLIN
jgi:flagellar basal body P-ring protein FlgI